jgi:hypothetical protein
MPFPTLPVALLRRATQPNTLPPQKTKAASGRASFGIVQARPCFSRNSNLQLSQEVDEILLVGRIQIVEVGYALVRF